MSTTRRNIKLTPRTKCPQLLGALRSGKKWLLNDNYVIQPEQVQTLEDCITIFEEHLHDCNCTSKPKIHLILGVCYLQKFNFYSLNFYDNSEALHIKLKLEETKKIEQEERQEPEPFNDIVKEYINSSKFKWKSDNSVSIENFKFLILSALKALKEFIKFFQSLDDFSDGDVTTLEHFFLLSHLNSLFQIFYFYNMLFQCYRVVDLSLGIYDKFYSNSSKLSDNIKTICSNSAKFFLRVGSLSSVKSIFSKFFTKEKLIDLTLNSFQNCEVFLLYVEYSIRIKDTAEILPKFKLFIKSEYLEKRTVRRYMSKGYALVTATKFSSSNYNYSAIFEEFTESYTMSQELVKKFTKSERLNSSVDKSDPLNLRYSCFNLFVDTSKLVIDFFLNTGIYNDASYHYNTSCNFFHRTLNIFELSNLQLKIAEKDLANGFVQDSINKTNLIENYYNWGQETREMFQPCIQSTPQCEKFILEDELLGKLDRLTLEDKARNVYQEVRQTSKATETFDDLLDNELRLFDLVNNNMNIFTNGKFFQDLFFFVLRYSYHRMLLQAKQKNTDTCFHNHLSQLLSMIEVYSRKQYIQSFNEYDCFSTAMKLNIKYSFQVNYMQIGETFFHFAIEYSQALINKRYFDIAFNFLDKAILISNNDYSIRVKRCELFYLHSYAAYKLTKSSFPNAQKIITLRYDDQKYNYENNKISENISIENDTNKVSSPCRRKTRILPKNALKGCAPIAKKQERYLTQQAEAELIRHTIPAMDFDFYNHSNECDNANQLEEAFLSSEDEISDCSDDLLKKCYLEYSNIEGITPNDCPFTENLKKVEVNIFSDLFERVLRLLMSKLFSYVGSHPPMILFEKSHFLSFKVAKMIGKSSSNLFFHISHVARSISFRYRMLLISFKKKKNQINVDDDIQRVKFCNSDYLAEAYWNSLPSNWRFVQLVYVEHAREPYLLIARFQPKKTTLFLKIKSQLQPLTFFENLLQEFQNIMTGNSLSFAEKEPKPFWEMRFSLDTSLGNLLFSFEKITTCIFRAMFLGVIECQKFQTARNYFMTRIRQQANIFELKDYDMSLLELFTDSIIFQTNNDFADGIRIIFGDCDREFVNICSQYRDKVFFHWKSFKALEALHREVNPLGLILCDQLLNFPFESLPTGKMMCQPYFRISSVKFAVVLYDKFKNSIDNMPQKNVYYLLNPQNNLAKTEALFKEKFQQLLGWKGVAGKDPDIAEFKQHLHSDDVYIYVGHGSGQSYYNYVGMDSFKLNPIAMVFGCSSARTIDYGKYAEVFGAPFRFLLHGSPCYIGSLWDITDKDIDAFTDDFLSGWFSNYDSDRKDKCPLMNRKIATSRDACKLKHLIGGAPVVYGLPISSLNQNNS